MYYLPSFSKGCCKPQYQCKPAPCSELGVGAGVGAASSPGTSLLQPPATSGPSLSFEFLVFYASRALWGCEGWKRGETPSLDWRPLCSLPLTHSAITTL